MRQNTQFSPYKCHLITDVFRMDYTLSSLTHMHMATSEFLSEYDYSALMITRQLRNSPEYAYSAEFVGCRVNISHWAEVFYF